MKFTLGFIAGLGAAWAALAIWQKIPTLGEIVWEADAEPDLPNSDPPSFEDFERDAIRQKLRMMQGDCTGFGGGIVTNIHGAP